MMASVRITQSKVKVSQDGSPGYRLVTREESYKIVEQMKRNNPNGGGDIWVKTEGDGVIEHWRYTTDDEGYKGWYTVSE